MALTEDLNIYRSMYKLLLAIIDARNDFDKSFKYVVGERMVNTLVLFICFRRKQLSLYFLCDLALFFIDRKSVV